MKNIRKFILSGISMLVLSCFTVAILPTDAFHRHDANHPSKVVCKDAQGEACQHKSHIGNRDGLCWVCAVHFDKSFTLNRTELTLRSAVSLNSFVALSLQNYQAEILQRTLRGPPAA